ncbi:MAG: hypothetical protein AUG75_05385 [Cyanobacteria bacterium 13_1_20CM_4_61_6]|nr:MAG: hypothetical protein AUG75_05385 [Cyanobacteria bacterium 13_1_20CM_4_61_6]
MTPLRVAYVLRVFPKISETFVASELAEVRRRGVEVRILSLRRPAEEVRHEIVARAGLDDLTVYDPREFPIILREFQPQLLHAHFATAATAKARDLAAEIGIPFTFTAHRYDVYEKAPADFADRAAAAGAVVTVSEANLRHIVKAFGVPAARIHVIPCGVDTERFQPDGRRAEPPLIVCVARLVPFKRVELLLEACAILRRRGVEFQCAIVGDGPCRDELETARIRLDLARTVELAGAAEQARVLGWWRRATAAVLPSDSEGMPVSLMEAAACGVPAVATAVGGIPELIEDGVTGFLTTPGDAEGLAGGLERLLRDPDLVARFGAAARLRAEEHFSLPRQVDRLLSVWRGLVGEAER